MSVYQKSHGTLYDVITTLPLGNMATSVRCLAECALSQCVKGAKYMYCMWARFRLYCVTVFCYVRVKRRRRGADCFFLRNSTYNVQCHKLINTVISILNWPLSSAVHDSHDVSSCFQVFPRCPRRETVLVQSCIQQFHELRRTPMSATNASRKLRQYSMSNLQYGTVTDADRHLTH